MNKKKFHWTVSYNKLWKLMIDKGVKNGQLRDAIGVSKSTMAKMSHNEYVAMPVLVMICEYMSNKFDFNCSIGDIVEVIPTAKPEPYYMAYENRYRKVFAAGAACWGHSPDDEILVRTLSRWVADNNLRGKRIIEYACGEGSCGIILSKLGCIYHGVDIAPTAVERAAIAVAGFPTASVSQLDMVNEGVNEQYDAALDVMGFHMLVTDCDRRKYLLNVADSLLPGAPALFFRESYRTDAYSGEVASFEDWCRISGSDYKTPESRRVNGSDITVDIPLVPARAKNKADYIAEMQEARFVVEKFVEMDMSEAISYSASIYVRRI